jgi:hypothetical protein
MLKRIRCYNSNLEKKQKETECDVGEKLVIVAAVQDLCNVDAGGPASSGLPDWAIDQDTPVNYSKVRSGKNSSDLVLVLVLLIGGPGFKPQCLSKSYSGQCLSQLKGLILGL